MSEDRNTEAARNLAESFGESYLRGVRNAGWPLMIQIDNPRIYHKDEKYRGMGYEPDVKIGSLPEVVTAVEQYNRNLKEGQN